MIRPWQLLRANYKRLTRLYVAAVFAFIAVYAPAAYAISAEQRRVIDSGAHYFDVELLCDTESTAPEADYTLKTTRDKIAQMLFVSVNSPDDADTAIGTSHVGGVYISNDWLTSTGNDASQSKNALTASGDKYNVPVFVGIDEEGGQIHRTKDLFGDMPSALAQGKTSDEDVRALAKDWGTKMSSLGVNVDFAPVLDLHNPSNPIIGSKERAYSSDPNVVASKAGSFADGLRDSAIVPVFKHFPGHGNSSGDSHSGRVSTPNLSELKSKDLVPYEKILPGSNGMVMTGHLDVPGLTTGEPASISKAAIDLLRNDYKFDGLVMTDDLGDMVAITSSYDLPTAAEKAILAGNDIALFKGPDKITEVLDRLEASAGNNPDLMARIEQSSAKIIAYKKQMFSNGVSTTQSAANPNTQEPTPAPQAAPAATTSKQVYFLGDSITNGAVSKYKAAFEQAGINNYINASGGRSWTGKGIKGAVTPEGSLKPGKEAVVDDESQIKAANIVIIALGSNGAEGANPIDEMMTKFKEINPNATYYWVNTATIRGLESLGAFNKSLADKSSEQGFQVIDWAKAVNPSGDPFTMPTDNAAGFIADGDNVHPSGAGQDALVKLVVDTAANGVSGATGGQKVVSDNCACDNGAQGGSTTLEGGDNEEKIWKWFIGKGYSPIVAAAFIGNMKHESGPALDPKQVEIAVSSPPHKSDTVPPDARSNGQPGYGLVQWTEPTRKQGLRDFSAERGVIAGDLGLQLEYLYVELEDRFKDSVTDPIRDMTDLAEATRIVLYKFENPRDKEGQRPVRVAEAEAVLAKYAGVAGGSVALTGSFSCEQQQGNDTFSGGSCEGQTSLPMPADTEIWTFNRHNHGNSVSYPPYEGKHGTLVNPGKNAYGSGNTYGNEYLEKTNFPQGEAVDAMAPAGTKVFAPTDGTVLRARPIRQGGRDGQWVMIESSNKKCISVSAHLSPVLVKEGDTVTAGQEVGRLKDMGQSSHNHFELWVEGVPVNIGKDSDPCTYNAGCSDTFSDEAEQIWNLQKQALTGGSVAEQRQ